MLSSWSYDGSGIMLDTIVPVDVDNGQTELSKVSMRFVVRTDPRYAL